MSSLDGCQALSLHPAQQPARLPSWLIALQLTTETATPASADRGARAHRAQALQPPSINHCRRRRRRRKYNRRHKSRLSHQPRLPKGIKVTKEATLPPQILR